MGIAFSSFLEKKQNQKNHPRSESNPGFQSAREMFARFSRGFIHAPGIPIGSEPWLACASKISRRYRAPGEKASADLKRLQQIFTMVQLASNLRDNRSRISKFKYSRAPRSGTCVPNLGPTSPTPLHSRSQRSKHRWSSNLLRASTTLWGERWDWPSLCLNRTYEQPDTFFFLAQRNLRE